VIINKDIYLQSLDDETTINQEVDIFLEHFGVKGMKWGIRNDKRGSRNVSKEPITAAQKRAKQKRNAKRVNRVIGSTVAVLYIAALLSPMNSSRDIPVNTLPKPNSDNKNSAHIKDSTHVISKNARETLMRQERERNREYQIKKMLKDMGEDVV
jgi:hypothetical protein